MSTHKNFQPLLIWLIKRNDTLDQIVFLFISKKNATNARHIPLFTESKNVRVVYLNGASIKYFDRLLLTLSKKLFSVQKKKLKKYKILHVMDYKPIISGITHVIHIDDPIYTLEELSKLLKWEEKIFELKGKSIIVVTNLYSKDWYLKSLKHSKIYIIEQGFHEIKSKTKHLTNELIFAYSSNYIHYGSDLHGDHSTWSANLLLDTIIPRIMSLNPSVKFYLIGELGRNAKKNIYTNPNIVSFGRVNYEENMEILSRCTVALYPRTFDHFRSVLKIFTYIGAELPIVTFDLIDTEIVSKKELGITVNDVDSFVLAATELINSPKKLEFYRNNIKGLGGEFSWSNLAHKMNFYLTPYV